MPPAHKRMVGGFNHNIKHKGQVYHVQTEDSGVENPHIITHLFVGGNILASRKTSYVKFLASKDLEKVVRSLMEDQHKDMLRKLVGGSFDRGAKGSPAPEAKTTDTGSPPPLRIPRSRDGGSARGRVSGEPRPGGAVQRGSDQ
jgi:hypothetical protein